ncbi:MAG TPA: hypothetical protein VEK08_19885, partial [Planctomycetota bacterium]|nr:hypothetical protein [Planctomycetota bacterium]
MANTQDNTLVLLGRFPGKDRAVASALAREFGRDESWAMQVVGAAPIILIDNLSSDLAQNVATLLAEVEAAGCRFEIQQGVDPNLAKLSWPAPPRIRGRLVTELLSGGAAGGSTATLIVPCPYTGQKMRLTITVSVAKEGFHIGATASAAAAPAAAAAIPAAVPIPVPASAARQSPVAVPIPVPVALGAGTAATNQAYKPIPTPVVSPALGRSPGPQPGQPPQPQQRRMTPAVGTPQPVIFGLDSLDELTPMEPSPAAAARPQTHAPKPVPVSIPSPRPIPIPSARPQAPAPLPDVPVIYNQTPQAGSAHDLAAQNNAPMPVDLLSAPMDLSQFEANVSASGIMRAVQAEQPDATEVSASAAEDDGALCSVSIG